VTDSASPRNASEAEPPGGATGLVERRAARIARGRFVVLSISATLVLMAVATAVVMRIVDPHDFPTIGLALWWALETFTTVGYGDIVPTTTWGKVVGGLMMVFGIMFLSFLTAAVTSTLIRRDQRLHDGALQPEDVDAILSGIARLEHRLEELETHLRRSDS
jgi:voltage-gated potassium channel